MHAASRKSGIRLDSRETMRIFHPFLVATVAQRTPQHRWISAFSNAMCREIPSGAMRINTAAKYYLVVSQK
ncbi:hypothetical protein [Xanthomonas sp. SHU 308]|uniref:hypothetical protein n=1 Tax=Xanthomonas sp. SHU 308 TaxID=1591201 RepID=UPI0012FEE5F8|nr:hypothetical protein [Xanthomonas sp. SHU 308]